ncbi:hypothetical protein ACHAXT_006961 [Thalassiosira profunda]
MRKPFLFAIAAALAAAAPANQDRDVVGTYVMADVQYDPTDQSSAGHPSHIDHIELGGQFHRLVNGPPGWAKHFASGQAKVQLPPGFIKRANGDIDLRGKRPEEGASPLLQEIMAAEQLSAPAPEVLIQPREEDGYDIVTLDAPEGDFAALGAQSRRNLAAETRSVLVVRVIGADAATTASESELSDSVFGTDGDPVNLRSQYRDCSHGQQIFDPTTYNGITDGAVTVTIANTISGTSDSTIRQAALDQLKVDFGVSSASALADHVLICIPPGTASSWIGYGYVNSWLTVYNDNWCTYPSIQMHEVGHNLNLAHSNEGGTTYGDQSGMMGYSYSKDDGPRMCFNPAKTWAIGWMSDARHTVDAGTSNWSGDIVGQAEYATRGGNPVLVKLNDPNSSTDYYIGFNRKTGHNSGTVEAGNQVTVVQMAGEGTSYAESDVLAKLSAGDSWSGTVSNGEAVIVTVNAIDLTTTPAIATIDIQTTAAPTTAHPSSSPTTPPPTVEPTNSPPTKAPTPEPTLSPTVSAAPSKTPTTRPTKEPTTFSCSELDNQKEVCQAHPTCEWHNQGPTKYCYCPNGMACYSGQAPNNNNNTLLPTNKSPTKSPSMSPTRSPSMKPVTDSPTESPTPTPTRKPADDPITESPSVSPTAHPTNSPSASPSADPTSAPSKSPSSEPTDDPTANPTKRPSASPIVSPTAPPTMEPSRSPTTSPSELATWERIEQPNGSPSSSPTPGPSRSPSKGPTNQPTPYPTTANPTSPPTERPTEHLTDKFDCLSISPVSNSQDCTVFFQCKYVSDGKNGKCCRNIDEPSECPNVATTENKNKKNPKHAAYSIEGAGSPLLQELLRSNEETKCRATGSCGHGRTGRGAEAP